MNGFTDTMFGLFILTVLGMIGWLTWVLITALGWWTLLGVGILILARYIGKFADENLPCV